jgi:hypothetical protein
MEKKEKELSAVVVGLEREKTKEKKRNLLLPPSLLPQSVW